MGKVQETFADIISCSNGWVFNAKYKNVVF